MPSAPFTIGVIISTYNNPEWLKKTLWGYQNQTVRPDEIIIADDGSDERTKDLIDSFRTILPLKHVRHEDKGFRKTLILNKALLASESDYLIFTDQDCIPREDFVEVHARYARPGHFLSGGYFKLPQNLSLQLSQSDVETGRVFSLSWLRSRGLPLSWKCSKLIRNGLFCSVMNRITPAAASWNGCNSSGWRKDMLAINGFNVEMQYGGEDREFGERLVRYGIVPIQLRYSAITVHLDHKRPYRDEEIMKRNKEIRRKNRKENIIITPTGLNCLSD